MNAISPVLRMVRIEHPKPLFYGPRAHARVESWRCCTSAWARWRDRRTGCSAPSPGSALTRCGRYRRIGRRWAAAMSSATGTLVDEYRRTQDALPAAAAWSSRSAARLAIGERGRHADRRGRHEKARDARAAGVSCFSFRYHARGVAGQACYFRSMVPRISEAWPGQVQKKAYGTPALSDDTLKVVEAVSPPPISLVLATTSASFGLT